MLVLNFFRFSVLQCGDEVVSRDQIRELGGLDIMYNLLHRGLDGDVDMLIAATNAVWKSITDNQENVKWLVLCK